MLAWTKQNNPTRTKGELLSSSLITSADGLSTRGFSWPGEEELPDRMLSPLRVSCQQMSELGLILNPAIPSLTPATLFYCSINSPRYGARFFNAHAHRNYFQWTLPTKSTRWTRPQRISDPPLDDVDIIPTPACPPY
jgi:hypothetical protein